MTRINTNVSSLVAQNTLGRSNASLNQALTRLSTGLRINTGKDDPAGLIASENLRSDITSIKRAITNTDRANQVIATADSALGQVSSLLNDIRGLVTESANTGALSDDQIKANQLQIDSSLEALNRIAQTTTFQGRRLLDGSLDFVTSAGTNFTRLADLKIDQANLGATGSISVDISVTTAATRAKVDIANIPTAAAAVAATGSLTFSATAGAVAATGTATLGAVTTEQVQASYVGSAGGGTNNYTIQIIDNPADTSISGGNGNNVTVVIQVADTGGPAATAAYDDTTDPLNPVLTITVDDDANITLGDIEDALNANSTFNANFEFVVAGADEATVFDNDPAGGDDTVSPGAAFDGGVTEVIGEATFTITGTTAAGADGNIDIRFNEVNLDAFSGADQFARAVANSDGSYTIQINNSGNVTVTLDHIRDVIEGLAEVNTVVISGTGVNPTGTDNYYGIAQGGDKPDALTLTGGVTAGPVADIINITADVAGAAGNVSVTVTETGISSLVGANGVGAAVDNNGNIQVYISTGVTSVTIDDIVAAINGLEGFSAVLDPDSDSDGVYSLTETPPATFNLTGGQNLGGILQDAVLQLTGATGSEVFNLQAGTSIADLVRQINLVQDATGISATANGTTLELTSTAYGSDAVVDVKIEEKVAGTFTAAIGSGARATGTDVVATVNGLAATGDGNQITINTATLDFTTSIVAGFTGSIGFNITGGGALFQLGPDVVSNQQARLGIGSVNTAALGGVSGKLYQLGNGGSASLSSGNLDIAAEIVEQAINQVTSLRGRLGAFQRTTLETNKQALNDTLVNLTEAESSIRDADFASETAALTRAQILVQSGTTVLQIANSNPQNVLALLRG